MNRLQAYETWPADRKPCTPDKIENLYLDVEISPHQSLSKSGFRIIICSFVGLSSLIGLTFSILLEAWPVLGFLGLEVILVWFGFKMSYRQGRKREYIKISSEKIYVHRTGQGRQSIQYTLPIMWTRIELNKQSPRDTQASLIHKQQGLIIGSMLSPDEREHFVHVIKTALLKAQTYSKA